METQLAEKTTLIPFAIVPVASEPQLLVDYRECRAVAKAATELGAAATAKFAPQSAPLAPEPVRDTFVRGEVQVRAAMALESDAVNASAWLALFATPFGVAITFGTASGGDITGAALAGLATALVPLGSALAYKWRRTKATLSNQARDLEEKLRTLTRQHQDTQYELASEQWRNREADARRALHGDSITEEMLAPLAGIAREVRSGAALDMAAYSLGRFAAKTLNTHGADLSAKAKSMLEEWRKEQGISLTGAALVAAHVEYIRTIDLTRYDLSQLSSILDTLPLEVSASVAREIRVELFDGPRYRFEGPRAAAQQLDAFLELRERRANPQGEERSAAG